MQPRPPLGRELAKYVGSQDGTVQRVSEHRQDLRLQADGSRDSVNDPIDKLVNDEAQGIFKTAFERFENGDRQVDMSLLSPVADMLSEKHRALMLVLTGSLGEWALGCCQVVNNELSHNPEITAIRPVTDLSDSEWVTMNNLLGSRSELISSTAEEITELRTRYINFIADYAVKAANAVADKSWSGEWSKLPRSLQEDYCFGASVLERLGMLLRENWTKH